jgi:hypothetical protein
MGVSLGYLRFLVFHHHSPIWMDNQTTERKAAMSGSHPTKVAMTAEKDKASRVYFTG